MRCDDCVARHLSGIELSGTEQATDFKASGWSISARIGESAAKESKTSRLREAMPRAFDLTSLKRKATGVERKRLKPLSRCSGSNMAAEDVGRSKLWSMLDCKRAASCKSTCGCVEVVEMAELQEQSQDQATLRCIWRKNRTRSPPALLLSYYILGVSVKSVHPRLC